jgi:hypothetical protein
MHTGPSVCVCDLYKINDHRQPPLYPNLSLLFCPVFASIFSSSYHTRPQTFIIKIIRLKNGVQWKRKPSTNPTFTYTFIIIFCLNYFINCILHVLLYRNIRKNVYSSLILLFEIIKYRSLLSSTTTHTPTHRSN